MQIDYSNRPLISRAIGRLRDKNTGAADFRYFLNELGKFMAYEMANELPTEEVEVETPLGVASMKKFREEIVIVSILRAALPMSDGVLEVLPEAKYGIHSASRGPMIGDDGRAFEIVTNYSKIPDVSGRTLVIVDPMLATGSTIISFIESLKGIPSRKYLLSAIASRYGVEVLTKRYTDLRIMAGAIDEILNSDGYIVPGLGDAGDRAFNTSH